jgi:hypothetical protein
VVCLPAGSAGCCTRLQSSPPDADIVGFYVGLSYTLAEKLDNFV